MAVKNSVKAIPLSSIDSSDFDDAYQLLGTLSNACFLIRIINNSSEDIAVSYDGVTDNDVVPKMTTAQLSLQTNAQPNTSIANLSAGTKVYVKGAEEGTGLVYLAGYYQPQAITKP